MRNIQATLKIALAAAGVFLAPAAAHAETQPMPLAVASLGTSHQTLCAPAVTASASYSSTNKNSALLGGQPSQLDLLRSQQQAATGPRRIALGTVHPSVPVPGSPAQLECTQMVRPGASGMRPGRGSSPLGPDDFLASKRLPVSRTVLDGQWNRVRSENLPRGAVATFASVAAGKNSEQLLSAVNAYANRRIRYVEDRKLYGQADYWATAGASLARGAGDCEDIAIVKMQLLAAAGVPRSDMFLTIARDLLRNADHAVLVVRAGGRNWLLDNSTDRLVDADQANDYRAIFSFSTDRRWLHGY